VAIEDSRWGLVSARDAGLRCVGVMNSYPASELPGAELVVEGLNTLTLEMLDNLVSHPAKGSGPPNPAKAGLHNEKVRA
jgi:beta-phosphoglucomutase-like phosphatase (HAD superfamily)